MTDISKDLKSYLTRNEKEGKKSLMNWFGSNSSSQTSIDIDSSHEQNNNANRWFGGGGQATQDSLIPSLGKKQRIMGFVFCIIMGLLCFSLAAMYFPMLLIKTRKFALLYTLGSLFFLFSFSVLWGPMNHLKHLCSKERILFTSTYLGTLFATLYFALVLHSTFLTGLCAVAQVLALFWYITSYIPGGQTGLKFFTKIFSSSVKKTAGKTLPI